jgi:hypothetical protein
MPVRLGQRHLHLPEVRGAGAALALALTLALSACGQSAEERFRTHDLRPLRSAMEQRQSQLAAVLRTAHLGNRRDARAVMDAVRGVSTVADRLAALQPPGSVAPQFVRYTSANRSLVRALRSFARALRAKDESRLGSASQAARDAAGAVRRADDGLQAALVG